MKKILLSLLLSFAALVNAAGTGITNPAFVAAGADAVARSYQDKARDVVSVKDFGAVGDGVADDGPAIRKAIDYIARLNASNTDTARGGGTVYLPAGRYRIGTATAKTHLNTFYPAGISITAGLHLASNPVRTDGTVYGVKIEGVSPTGSVLVFDSTTAAGIDMGNCGRCEIRNLSVVAATSSTGWGIDGIGSGYSRIEKVSVLEYKNGIRMAGYNMEIADSVLQTSIATGGTAIQFGEDGASDWATTVATRHNYIMGHYAIGIDPVKVKHGTYTSDIIEYCTKGIRGQTGTSGSHRVINPYFENCTKDLSIDDASQIVMEGWDTQNSYFYTRLNRTRTTGRLSAGSYGKAADQAIPTDTYTRVLFDQNKNSFVQTDMAAVSGLVTISERGLYMVRARIGWNATSTGKTYVVTIARNPTTTNTRSGTVIGESYFALSGNTLSESIATEAMEWFEAGETIDVKVYNNHGSDRTVDGSRSVLTIERVQG